MKKILVVLTLIICFFKYEQSFGGMTKICYYDRLGDTVAITVSSVTLCPLTINM